MYNFVHLLDLCTLAYQLHSQTLIWPMDPYYEQWSSELLKRQQLARRKEFMREVHRVATPANPNYIGCRGPAKLNSAPASNEGLDPVIADYNQINPWRPGLTRQNKEQEGWILYNTPKVITNRIGTVSVAYYDPAWHPLLSSLNIQRPAPPPGTILPPATDLLYCFEGGTGGLAKVPPAWSMMGFVLAREDDTVPPPRPYDLYIVFRGSRSGDPRFGTALASNKGNPDWVTDMNFGLGAYTIEANPEISQRGHVSPGFAFCMHTMLPNIMKCLEDIQRAKQNAPRAIYVTGHSLGASLAVHFTSAILLGSTYHWNAPLPPTANVGPDDGMPVAIRPWPWSNMLLTPFALPVVGDAEFSEAFNRTLASIRIFIEGDPVTLEYRHYPVGFRYGIDTDKLQSTEEEKKKLGAYFSGARHEPFNIRRYLIKDQQKVGKLPDPLPGTFPSDEPWKVFETFKGLIKELSLSVHYTRVDQILGTRFNVRLLQYLEILEAITKANEEKQLITELRKAIGEIIENSITNSFLANRLMSLVFLCEKFRDRLASNRAQFLGSCLVLSLASKMSLSEARQLLEGKSFAQVYLQ
jgi:hypothetical protein